MVKVGSMGQGLLYPMHGCEKREKKEKGKGKFLLLPSDALLQASHGPSRSRRLGVYPVWLAGPTDRWTNGPGYGMDSRDDAKSVSLTGAGWQG